MYYSHHLNDSCNVCTLWNYLDFKNLKWVYLIKNSISSKAVDFTRYSKPETIRHMLCPSKQRTDRLISYIYDFDNVWSANSFYLSPLCIRNKWMNHLFRYVTEKMIDYVRSFWPRFPTPTFVSIHRFFERFRWRWWLWPLGLEIREIIGQWKMANIWWLVILRWQLYLIISVSKEYFNYWRD